MNTMNRRPVGASDLKRLTKICGLFSSAFPGERSNAAALADRFVRERGWEWHEVLAAPSLPPSAPEPPATWQQVVAACRARSDLLSQWERRFLDEIATYQHPPSTKQLDALARVAKRVFSS
jgi:hypothetical protein